jgi:hypothetical protein
MPIYIEVSALVERPVEDVFRIHAAEHVQNHPRWDPYIQLEQISKGPLEVGTMIKRINSHSGVPVKGTMEVIQFEPDKSLGMLIKEGHVELSSIAFYEAKGPDQTVLTLKTEFFGLDESVDENALTSQMESAVQNHKQFIESEP